MAKNPDNNFFNRFRKLPVEDKRFAALASSLALLGVMGNVAAISFGHPWEAIKADCMAAWIVGVMFVHESFGNR